MTPSIWLALLAACLMISFTPGAGAINTMTNSITVGFRRSFWGILGQQAALLIQLVIVAAGLGVVIARSPTAFAVIRYAGAAYLIYLGIRQFRRASSTVSVEGATDDVSFVAAAGESAWSVFRRGVWVNLLNPKAIVFLLAFIPGFVRADRSMIGQYGIIGLTIVTVDILVMWFFFALVAQGFRRWSTTAAHRRSLDRLFGLLFIAVGVMLAVI